MIEWKSVVSSHDPKYMVKGTVIDRCYCGELSRYCIELVRAYDHEGYATLTCHVRDADMVTDFEISKGKRSPIVFRCNDIDEAFAFCGIRQ